MSLPAALWRIAKSLPKLAGPWTFDGNVSWERRSAEGALLIDLYAPVEGGFSWKSGDMFDTGASFSVALEDAKASADRFLVSHGYVLVEES